MSTFASRRLSEIYKRCVYYAQKAACEDGYISMHSLAALFDAEVVFRPLLVEAMIAKNTNLLKGGPTWKILLDADRFAEESAIYPYESSRARLSVRIRNTIAHELIHTFQFKIKDNEIVPDRVTETKSRSDAIIRLLEREAHELTSLLLIPRHHLEGQIENLTLGLNVCGYVDILHKYGTSREIFIQALNRLNLEDHRKILSNPNIVDVLIGIGSWGDNRKPHFRTWPRFTNFSNKSLPEFLIEQLEEGVANFEIPNLPDDFCLLGGTRSVVRIVSYEGSRAIPNYQKVEYELSVEVRTKGVNVPFLFMLRRVGVVENQNVSSDVAEEFMRQLKQ